MTTPEHALVGIHAAFSVGVHRRLGWQAVALAAVASVLPDWDGLLILIDIRLFDQGHRVWGHNLISITLTSLLLAISEVRWSWISKLGNLLVKHLPRLRETRAIDRDGRHTECACYNKSHPLSEYHPVFSSLLFVAILSQLLHLPCDMVVSGGGGLADWEIQPWWPFSDRGYVFPLIPWGDVGPTVILMAGVIIAAKRPERTSAISAITLTLLVAYLLLRGWTR